MASWATRRKYTYLLIFLGALVVFVGLPLFGLLYEAPSCFDGKQNGGERGIDCGGSCARLCSADYGDPRILWTHSTKVVPGVYNSMAYIQNPNQSVEAANVQYSFKLYDNKGILVATRDGKAYIPAGQRFVVFGDGIRTGERAPVRTTFEFMGQPDWRQGSAFTGLRVLSIDVSEGSSPRAQAVVENEMVTDVFTNVDAYIVLYNKDDNRVAFSKTLIERIAPGERQTLYFTWPEALPEPILRSELIFVNKPR